MWGETGDFGMYPHKSSVDMKDGPKLYTNGMAPSCRFPTVANTTTPADPVVLGEYVFYLVHQHRALSIMDCIDFLCRTQRKTYWDTYRMKIVGNYLELF